MPALLFRRIRPFRLQLSQILPDDDVVIIRDWFLAVFVVVYPLLAVALNDTFTKNFHSFVGHLTFTGALLDGLQKLDGVFGTAFL